MKILLITLLALALNACGRSGASEATETAQFKIEGMTCENCVAGISSSLGRIDGITHYAVNLESESAEIHFQSSKLTAPEIAERISRIGYPTTVAVPTDIPDSEEHPADAL